MALGFQWLLTSLSRRPSVRFREGPPNTKATFLTYCSQYPGRSEWAGRHLRLSFRGLLKVHSRYGLPACYSPMAYIFPQSFGRNVSLSHCLGLGNYRDGPRIFRTGLSPAGNFFSIPTF